MRIAVYDVGEHDFATRMVIHPLMAYRQDIQWLDTLIGVKNTKILAYYNHFDPETIIRLKNDGNKLYSIDVNDGSTLGACYQNNDAALLLEMIFKFSGLQNVRYSDQLELRNDATFYLKPREFVKDKEWEILGKLRALNKIQPMPHIPWFMPDERESLPWEQRKQKVLVRGGLHTYRFLLYLKLLQNNLIDGDSNFHVKTYFNPAVDPHHRYCDDCLAIFHDNGGRLSYDDFNLYDFGCKERYAQWWREIEEDYFIKNALNIWNNGCLPFFYWLAEKYEARYGKLHMMILEEALHGDFLPREAYWKILSRNRFYADYKWLFCIDIPPRFWEAAGARTLTLLPKWTQDQTHFPELIEGEHYLTFDNDLSDFGFIDEITKEQHDHITNNCKGLYDKWIRASRYALNENLMDLIMCKVDMD